MSTLVPSPLLAPLASLDGDNDGDGNGDGNGDGDGDCDADIDSADASVGEGARLACRSRMHCVLKELLAHLCGIFGTISRKQAVIWHAFLGRS